MAFKPYRTWNVGELVTKAMLDEQIRDNGIFLYYLANTRIFSKRIVPRTVALTVGDAADIVVIPYQLNGFNLIDADIAVDVASTSGLPTVQYRNIDKAVDMLSTRMTIDANELNSWSAATQPVINPANAGVLTGHRIAVDVDVAGTGTMGLTIFMVYRIP